MSRKEYIKLMYQGNQNVIGKKKNQVQVAIDLWRTMMNKAKPTDPKLREIVALFNDQVGTFDARKLLNLRRLIMAGADMSDAELISKV